MAALGAKHALVVHGEPGLDEVSPLGPTHVIEVIDGVTKRWAIHPEEHGFKNIKREDLAGSEPEENARIIGEILNGGGSAGARAAVILNAAAAVYVSGRVKSYGRIVRRQSPRFGRANSVPKDELSYSKPLKQGLAALPLEPSQHADNDTWIEMSFLVNVDGVHRFVRGFSRIRPSRSRKTSSP